ncbi:MAG: IclR family transcriptional regulator [Rhizobiales bacterium]|nr:IclR family transcriptional regulator [Hyphomicrobiales bacterium]
MSEQERPELNGSRSAHRVVAILDLLLRRDEPTGVAEIASALSIPRSTAYNIVNVLSEARYLEPSGPGGKLFLGPKLFELGMAYGSKIDLLKEGAPIVRELRDATGETVQLSILDADMLLVVMKEEGSRPVRIISRVGSRVPVNWAAGGRLVISDLADNDLRRLLRNTVRPSPTGKASTDVELLFQQVRAFRQRGHSIEIGETNEHAGCVAAPVLDAADRCIAAISIAAPEQRLKSVNRKRLVTAVCDAARRLSHRLGAGLNDHSVENRTRIAVTSRQGDGKQRAFIPGEQL